MPALSPNFYREMSLLIMERSPLLSQMLVHNIRSAR